MTQQPGADDLAELRTQMARFREQSRSLVESLTEETEALRTEHEAARAERERGEREFWRAYREGRLDPDRHTLAQRMERGETSWREILDGRDSHDSAVAYRAQVGREVDDGMAQLMQDDPELRDSLLDLHDAAARSRREGM